ncbi:MAG: hypothetical protein ACOCYN_04025 [Planctomycetota bacterium]
MVLLACCGLAAVESDYDPYYDHAWSDLDYDSYTYEAVEAQDPWLWEAESGPTDDDYYQQTDASWEESYEFRSETWGWNWEQEPPRVGAVDGLDDDDDDADDYYEDFDPDADFDTEWDADLDAGEDPIEATRDYDANVDDWVDADEG